MSEHKHEEESKEHGGHGGGGHGGGGHGGGGGHEEHEGAPEWLISFADNVTLMMGFFVILLAMNLGPKGGSPGKEQPGPEGESKEPPLSFMDAALSIREAFNNPVDLNSIDPNDRPLVRHLLERKGKAQVEADGPKGDEHDVQSLRPSKYFSVCGAVPFEEGSSVLTPTAAESLNEVARHVRGVRLIVDVRGNVSAAEGYENPEGAMRLAFDRALAVARELVARGVEWKQIRIMSLADNDRVKSTVYDKAGHQVNQRVEIIVTDQVMNEPSRDSSKDITPTPR
ncbi:MAG: OmpA family protein [Planctomycetes bacterium]|nr:OmpA family protein [Planctomycetota bacterium]MBI3835882.1 OmpA family protein [Planctomycetota bacterium]